MERGLEELIWQRANRRCEYCQFPAAYAVPGFQIDHIIAKKHGGETRSENLALACCYCNSFKGPNIAGINQRTGDTVTLCNPRRQKWNDHFEWDGPWLRGKTDAGEVTILVLNINHPDAVAVRLSLIEEGVFPNPKDA